MIEKMKDNLYRIVVRLPDSPLRLLNSYVVLGRGRNLLIDTGFNWNSCYQDLQNGLAEVGISMADTDLFLTHFHADHSGLVSRIISGQTKVYMSPVEKEMLDASIRNVHNPWVEAGEILRDEGFPEAELMQASRLNPARVYGSETMFDVVSVHDGDRLNVGGISLEVIGTPGHTPGHMCLYWPQEKVLFSGDHILFDITPNIQIWKNFTDPLGHYLDSLGKVRELKAEQVLTGHRENHGSLAERVDALLNHHHQRFAEIIAILSEQETLNAYEIAGRMRWSIRADSWAEFPITQKWFAVGETIAHLHYMEIRKLLRSQTNKEIKNYLLSSGEGVNIGNRDAAVGGDMLLSKPGNTLAN